MTATVPRTLRIVNWIAAALFLVSAGLQLNDPDPAGWFAIYVLAGAACLVWPWVNGASIPPALVGIAALVWALFYVPSIPGMAFGDLFGAMKAGRPAIEEAREMLGLLIIVAWMAVLVLRTPRS